jgi:hypothetical protein
VENNLIKGARLNSLMQEGNEILSIVVASAKTTRAAKEHPTAAQIVYRKS